MKNEIRNVILIIAVQIFLPSCTGKSPESVGEKWADKSCECFKIDKQSQIDITMQIKELAKKGTYKTLDEVQQASQEMLTKVDYKTANEKAKNCYKELKELEQQIKIEFVKEDERQTIRNKFTALTEECEKDINHQMYVDDDEMRSILKLPSGEEAKKSQINDSLVAAEKQMKSAEEAVKKAMGK